MTPERPAPVLVLALGNLLLEDDGLGPVLLEELRGALAGDDRVELVDGGTQGLALLGLLEGREAVLLLDAVALGDLAGTVHECAEPLALACRRGVTAHEGNAGELLSAADLCGLLPPVVHLLGVEPARTRTGVGLSAEVRGVLPEVSRRARAWVAGRLGPREELPCTR